jgi:hypothetical protein
MQVILALLELGEEIGLKDLQVSIPSPPKSHIFSG